MCSKVKPPSLSDRNDGSIHRGHVRSTKTELSPDLFGRGREAVADGRRLGHIELVLAIITAGIVFGALYPFAFRVPTGGIGPVRTLVESWAERPGRGDFLANILMYVPFGMFTMLSRQHRPGLIRRVLGVIVAGGVLSVAMELTQYFDEGRVTAATDVYADLTGTTVGAVAGAVFRVNSHFLLINQLRSNPVPTLLMTTWVAYRLFPYEPTIDLHKYWNALKPIILYPSLSVYDLFRHTVIWLTLFAMITAIVGERRHRVLAALFAGCVLIAKVLIIDAVLSVAEIVGAAVALCLWSALRLSWRWRATLLAALLAAYIIVTRLEPFVFLPVSHAFGWVPFTSFLDGGSLEVNILSFFEKTFLYGSLMFLLTEAGLQLGVAALLVATCLFMTSWIETYLPGRSAEITDAVMALLIAAVFALLRRERPERLGAVSRGPFAPNHRQQRR